MTPDDRWIIVQRILGALALLCATGLLVLPKSTYKVLCGILLAAASIAIALVGRYVKKIEIQRELHLLARDVDQQELTASDD
jgi:cell division protein FtsL